MKKSFAAFLLLLICVHSAHIGAAPQKGEAPRAWLSDQVMRSRTSGNSGVEADALARLLSMDPNDPATKLELLRLKVRDPHIAFKELEQLVDQICTSENVHSNACRQGRILLDAQQGNMADQLASARLMALAGQGESALATFEELFGGLPEEESLQLEYARIASAVPDKQAVAKRIYEQLTRSDSPVISNTARIALNSLRFEQTLAKALSVVYTDAGRASAVPVLEAALKSHPDDSRAERWRNALLDAQFWLAVERGDAALNAKRFQAAERAYREAMPFKPSSPYALLGLANVEQARGRYKNARDLVQKALGKSDVSGSERLRLLRRIDRLNALEVSAAASRLAPDMTPEGDFAQPPTQTFISALRHELTVSKGDPWVRLRLARSLLALHQKREADDLWEAHADDGTLAYKHAKILYFVTSGQNEKALALLDTVIPEQSNAADGWLALSPLSRLSRADTQSLLALAAIQQRLRSESALQEAEALAQQNEPAEALRTLLPFSPEEPYLRARMARWAEASGDAAQAFRLWKSLSAVSGWEDEALFGQVRALLRQDVPAKEAAVELMTQAVEARRAAQTLTPDFLIRITSFMDDAGASNEADQMCVTEAQMLGSAKGENAAMLLRRAAQHLEAAGDAQAALKVYEEAFLAAGLLTEPVPSANVFTRAMRTASLPERAPNDEPNALDADGWLTLSLKSRASELYQHNQTEIRTGLDFKRDPGTSGYSDLTAVTSMTEAEFPAFSGRARLRTDWVWYRVGSLKGSPKFGTITERPGSSLQTSSDMGASLAFAWTNDQFAFDIGTTPIGFLYTDLVGALAWSWDVGEVGLTLEVYRRPEEGSLLAFGGQRDPGTGRTWGGVRRLGTSLNASWDQGERNGFWGRAAANQITGHHVADNSSIELMGGWYHRLINRPNHELRTGASLLFWHYQKDLSDYVWGQGGYYSPQAAVSLGSFLEDRGRTNNWSWTVEGRLGLSMSKSSERDRYPLKDELRRENLPDLYAREASSTSSGIGVSFKGAVERRLGPQAFAGVSFAYTNADGYAPLYLGFWLRFPLTPWEGDLPMPPEPMVPYARW